MKAADLHTLCTRRVFGLEKKNRFKTHVYIEREITEILETHGINTNDFSNLALQEFISANGIPVLMMSIRPGGEADIRQPTNSDIINLALCDLLKKKGYVRPVPGCG